MIDLHTIATEQRNPATTAIDTLSTQDLVALINQADKEVLTFTKSCAVISLLIPGT